MSTQIWWDQFSDHLLYPLLNDFLEAETKHAARCPNIIQEDNEAVQSWYSSIVNPWAETNPENQDESLVSVSNTNPNFDPKITCTSSELKSARWRSVFFCRTPWRITSAQVASQNLRWKVQDSLEQNYVSLPSDRGTSKIVGLGFEEKNMWHKIGLYTLLLKAPWKGELGKTQPFTKEDVLDRTFS